MTKVSRRKINDDDFGRYLNNLWSAFTLLSTKEDIRLLFKDIFTHTEYTMFAKRFEIARRLLDEATYEQIKKDLAVTERTIAAVSNILAEKGEGYIKAHKKLSDIEAEKRTKESERLDRMSNPFKYKTKRKTALGVILKAGAEGLDNYIERKIKNKSAKRTLPN